MNRSSPDADPDPGRFRELVVADEPDFGELLECVLGITEPVAELYRLLLAEPGSTVADLAERTGHDRSSVNRKLDVLREQGLATRRRELLDGGGFVYRYEAASLERTRELMHRTLAEWTAFMHGQIDDVEETLEPPA